MISLYGIGYEKSVIDNMKEGDRLGRFDGRLIVYQKETTSLLEKIQQLASRAFYFLVSLFSYRMKYILPTEVPALKNQIEQAHDDYCLQVAIKQRQAELEPFTREVAEARQTHQSLTQAIEGLQKQQDELRSKHQTALKLVAEIEQLTKRNAFLTERVDQLEPMVAKLEDQKKQCDSLRREIAAAEGRLTKLRPEVQELEKKKDEYEAGKRLAGQVERLQKELADLEAKTKAAQAKLEDTTRWMICANEGKAAVKKSLRDLSVLAEQNPIAQIIKELKGLTAAVRRL